jgi:hypothetical protein
MDRYTATELAYKNGYKKGYEDAVKEFAERLKEKAYPFPCAIGVERAVAIRAINDTVEEMAGDGKC